MEGAAPVPAPFLSPPEVNEALTKLWQRHVACSVGLGGLADANLDAAALQALAPLAQYCDTYRDPRIHRVFAEALDMDPGAVVGPDVVRKMAMTAVAKRHAALFCDGTPDAAGSQDWVTQYRPVTADESGSGKTAAAYACAAQHGYVVIEVNPSSQRGKKQILDMIGEATQSRRLVLSASNSLDSMFGAFKPKSPVPDPGRTHSLILLDEADVVFEDDKGYESAVMTLIEAAKCPVILTANSTNLSFNSEFMSRLPFTKPAMNQLHLLMESICFAEGVCVPPVALMRLIALFSQDIRRVMHTMELWARGRLTPPPHLLTQWDEAAARCGDVIVIEEEDAPPPAPAPAPTPAPASTPSPGPTIPSMFLPRSQQAKGAAPSPPQEKAEKAVAPKRKAPAPASKGVQTTLCFGSPKPLAVPPPPAPAPAPEAPGGTPGTATKRRRGNKKAEAEEVAPAAPVVLIDTPRVSPVPASAPKKPRLVVDGMQAVPRPIPLLAPLFETAIGMVHPCGCCTSSEWSYGADTLPSAMLRGRCVCGLEALQDRAQMPVALCAATHAVDAGGCRPDSIEALDALLSSLSQSDCMRPHYTSATGLSTVAPCHALSPALVDVDTREPAWEVDGDHCVRELLSRLRSEVMCGALAMYGAVCGQQTAPPVCEPAAGVASPLGDRGSPGQPCPPLPPVSEPRAHTPIAGGEGEEEEETQFSPSRRCDAASYSSDGGDDGLAGFIASSNSEVDSDDFSDASDFASKRPKRYKPGGKGKKKKKRTHTRVILDEQVEREDGPGTFMPSYLRADVASVDAFGFRWRALAHIRAQLLLQWYDVLLPLSRIAFLGPPTRTASVSVVDRLCAVADIAGADACRKAVHEAEAPVSRRRGRRFLPHLPLEESASRLWRVFGFGRLTGCVDCGPLLDEPVEPECTVEAVEDPDAVENEEEAGSCCEKDTARVKGGSEDSASHDPIVCLDDEE